MRARGLPPRPPRLAARLLELLFPDQRIYSTLGDTEEIFRAEAERGGLGRARRWYWLQVAKALPHRLLALLFIDIPMFAGSVKVMFRSLRKHRSFSFLTLIALTLGLTSFFLIFLYVRYESTYDSFHPGADRIFRLILEDAPGDGQRRSAGPAAHALEARIPEIEATVQTCHGFSPIVKEGKAYLEAQALFVGEDFFRMFRFPLLRGSEGSLAEPGQVILTEQAARRFFGSADPLGRSLDSFIRGDPCRLTVSGLMADPPLNTHFQFDLLISYPTTQTLPGYKALLEKWQNRFPRTYVKLRREATLRAAERKIAISLAPAPQGTTAEPGLRAILQPLPDLHLRPDGKNDSLVRALSLFFYLSILVLAVAVMNYVNLATSRSSLRRHEVGVRKTIGAGRRDLVKQFIGEALVLTVASFALATAALYVLLPVFNKKMGHSLALPELLAVTSGWEIAGILTVVGIAAGSYPALLLSSFPPARILKAPAAGNSRPSRLRNVLVVAQFASAVALVVVTLFIRSQIRFIGRHDPGFDASGVVEAWAFPPNAAAAKNRILQNPKVVGASLTSNVISLSDPAPLDKRWGEVEVRRGQDWKALDLGVFHLKCDPDLIRVFGLRLLSGRDFSPSRDERGSAIINESLARQMGPGDAVGSILRVKDREHTVIGVVKDFYFQPLYAEIGPVLLTQVQDNYALLYVRFGEADRPEALSFVKSVLDEFFPEESHAPVFLEDRLAALYKREAGQAALLSFFSTFAVIIAGLGILGLAAFSVERRTREIGVRKILGARTGRLFLLLSSDFAGLLAIANVLGWPFAYYFANRWLSNFAYHVPIRMGTFVWAAAGLMVLALIASGTQILRISRIDPVRTLRSE